MRWAWLSLSKDICRFVEERRGEGRGGEERRGEGKRVRGEERELLTLLPNLSYRAIRFSRQTDRQTDRLA